MPPDENDFQTPQRGDWRIRGDHADARRIGAAARRSIQTVLPGWQGQALAPDDRALQTTIEAQIAASCLGHKPLFFEPIIATEGRALALAIGRIVPVGVEVHSLNSGIVVFRPECVRPILEGDVEFYRPDGESDLSAINRVCSAGDNGELLGYGARNWAAPHGVRVTISDEDSVLFMFFVSNPREAEHHAHERLRDIASYTLQSLEYDISPP